MNEIDATINHNIAEIAVTELVGYIPMLLNLL
jgi:hypothetical protein